MDAFQTEISELSKKIDALDPAAMSSLGQAFSQHRGFFHKIMEGTPVLSPEEEGRLMDLLDNPHVQILEGLFEQFETLETMSETGKPMAVSMNLIEKVGPAHKTIAHEMAIADAYLRNAFTPEQISTWEMGKKERYLEALALASLYRCIKSVRGQIERSS